MRRIVLLAAVGALLVAPAAQAQTWTEQGDAGQLIPQQQNPIGAGPLAAIVGNVGGSADPADCYSIWITNVPNFQATTVGTGTTLDTQLFLFDKRTHNGVTHNDDDPLGVGGLQSRITGAFVPAPGFYALCISAYNSDPSSPTGLIWTNTPFNTERAPNGPGAPGPLTSWAGASGAGSYNIALTGVDYKPEPATLSLLALGSLMLLRRRRA